MCLGVAAVLGFHLITWCELSEKIGDFACSKRQYVHTSGKNFNNLVSQAASCCVPGKEFSHIA
jgi:hypothetical protein